MSSPSTLASKRQSILITATTGGPRPLHLAQMPLNSPGGPLSAPALYPEGKSYFTEGVPLSPATLAVVKGAPRRQSSISYTSSPRANGVSRSNSVGRRTLTTGAGDRRSTGSIQSGERERERPPVTLVEKHAELLHFIAQKESKCLELRSSLALHEAELLQLKRKWERIVSRGFDRTSISSESSTIPNGTAPNTPNGAVLDGIREGVSGVSRFIYAGLGELSQPSSPGPPRRGHTANQSNQSNSSASTFATNSTGTRLSQSSVSSVECEAEEDDGQVLMVHDTGATPTMSPNPVFLHAQKQQKESPSIRGEGGDFFETSEAAAKLHRRKSLPRSQSRAAEAGGKATPALLVPTCTSSTSSVKLRVSPTTNPTTFEEAQSSSTLVEPAPSTWLGHAGKKWEEIQRTETFTKSQKRASLMLSDVSQSIASALLSPPMTSSPLHFAASALTVNGSGGSPSLHAQHSSSSSSLLDDDSDGVPSSMSAMTPMIPSMSVLTPSKPQPRPPKPTVPMKVAKPAAVKKEEDEDEWNW